VTVVVVVLESDNNRCGEYLTQVRLRDLMV
ncbi:uncharacterized protein METZ01_LOCUS344431, partial [marine metagenome]